MAIEKLRGIVTNLLRHNDRHNVVTLFTRTRGRVALLTPAGQGKTARMRNALLQPLAVIETDLNFNSNRELQFLGRFSSPRLWREIYFDPVKRAVGMFLAEFLNTYLRESPPDEKMWDFIVESLGKLDASQRGASNLHLAFLTDFLSYAGVRPDLEDWQQGCWFDMRSGICTLLPPGHKDYLSPAETQYLPLLARMGMSNAAAFRFASGQRREILAALLKYYAVHFPGLSALKSPEVLAEVFS